MHPFDLQHTLLAKHAQHVVLVHFPVALVMVALLFDLLAHWRQNRVLAAAAYYNLSIAAVAAIPTVITGLIAWRWQLEGAPLRGILRLHLMLGVTSAVLICLTWWVANRDQKSQALRRRHLVIELVTVGTIAVTAHLGGIVSGVNV